MVGKRSSGPTLAQQEAEILAFFVDLIEQDEDCTELCRFLLHIGIDNTLIEQAGGPIPAILDHYRCGHSYDTALLTRDMVRYPPIAGRIRELKSEHARKPTSRH